MNDRCKICIDPKCDGRMDCDCATCDKQNCCPRVLRPTIRITRKCSQKCAHCCFSCGPDQTDHMTIATARTIAKFLKANDITYSNIMGGEFWLCRNWERVLGTLIEPLDMVRIVTNGDWAAKAESRHRVVEFFAYRPKCWIMISKDRFHTNTNIDAAAEACIRAAIHCKIQDKDDKNAIVPVGRSAFDFGFYGTFSCYCHNPDKMYAPLIDETGTIFKCGFRIWDYAHVKDHLGGDFHCVFKEFGLKFNKIFVSNCARCSESYRMSILKPKPRLIRSLEDENAKNP